jgi:hypothetical protein
VAWVAVFSTLAGLLYGAWVDGASIWRVGLYVAAAVATLALIVYLFQVRQRGAATRPETAQTQHEVE